MPVSDQDAYRSDCLWRHITWLSRHNHIGNS
jgi:hypothetical protein